MMNFDFTDKVIVITGATGLLGQGYCEAFASKNGKVIMGDLDFEKTAQLSKKINQKYGDLTFPILCDVNDEESIINFLKIGYKKFGKITSVVNNAAATGEFLMTRGEVFTELSDFSSTIWSETIKTNLTGPFIVCRESVKYLKDSGGGSIVNVSSTYGIVGPDHRIYEGLPFNSTVAYAASKAGINGLTRWLATYLGKDNIRVNTLVPGGVYNNHDPIFVERYSARTPLGKMADRLDMVGMVLFLISDMSSYCTGQQYFVDGGWTAI